MGMKRSFTLDWLPTELVPATDEGPFFLLTFIIFEVLKLNLAVLFHRP